jgi:hypothetical protein
VSGFIVKDGSGWKSSWTQNAMLMVGVARVVLSAVMNKHNQMDVVMEEQVKVCVVVVLHVVVFIVYIINSETFVDT